MYEVEPASIAGTFPPEVKDTLHRGVDLQCRNVLSVTKSAAQQEHCHVALPHVLTVTETAWVISSLETLTSSKGTKSDLSETSGWGYIG